MEVIYGLALISVSILLLFFAARFRNAPNAPEWSKSGVVLQTVLFTTVVGFIFGLSMLFDFGANYASNSFGLLETGLLVATAAITWACWTGIQKMPAPVAVEFIGTADDLPPPANTDGPGMRVHGNAHKAA